MPHLVGLFARSARRAAVFCAGAATGTVITARHFSSQKVDTINGMLAVGEKFHENGQHAEAYAVSKALEEKNPHCKACKRLRAMAQIALEEQQQNQHSSSLGY